MFSSSYVFGQEIGTTEVKVLEGFRSQIPEASRLNENATFADSIKEDRLQLYEMVDQNLKSDYKTKPLAVAKVKDDKNQILDLYNLLEKREYNISHASLPSFREHSEFVANNPYREWFILYDANEPVGSFYIKNDNSIGINMLEQNPIYINMTMYTVTGLLEIIYDKEMENLIDNINLDL